MTHLAPAFTIYSRMCQRHSHREIGWIQRLPGAVRRMGLVRCLEWLAAGNDNRDAGIALHGEMAPTLGLSPRISEAVEYLETCDRSQAMEVHRRAVALFDALARQQQIAELS